MSSINFSQITAERPELKQVAERVKNWLDKNESVRAIDPSRLAREINRTSFVSPIEIADFFSELETRGVVEGTFRLKQCDGTLVGDDYDSPDEIPDVVEDIFGNSFRKDSCRIALVFKVQ